MKASIAIPQVNLSKFFTYLFIILLCISAIDATQKKLRNEADFSSIESYCGVLKKYYYRKAIRGQSGMRAVISNDMLGDDKRFEIGEPYKKSSNIISSDDIGKKICVYYLDKAVFYDPFIFQISIEGDNRLNLSDMKNEYLSPSMRTTKVMGFIFFILILIIQLRKIYLKRSNT